MTSLDLYLFFVYGSFLNLYEALIVICVIYLVINIVYRFTSWVEDSGIETDSIVVKHVKMALISLAVLTTIATFMPTQKEVAAIIIVPRLVNNEDVKSLPDNIAGLFSDLVLDVRKDLKREAMAKAKAITEEVKP